MDVHLQPLNDRIVVKPLAAPDKSPGGIILPDQAQEKPTRGLVLAVGPGLLLTDGTRGPMDCAPGDLVVYRKYGGDDYSLGQDEYKLIRQEDVLAKIIPGTGDWQQVVLGAADRLQSL